MLTVGFLGMDCWIISHFATVSYAFCQRFPDELTSEIFEQMLINSLRTYRMLEKYMNKQ